MTRKIKYETPNLRLKGFNLEPPKGKELDQIGLYWGIKRAWWGFESDSHFYERIRAMQVNSMRRTI